MATGREAKWCILRTSNANTLPLARSLEAAGFTVWVPVELVTHRVPRHHVKRKVATAMIPVYVFAAADALLDLIQLANTPGKQHRDFTVYKHNGRFPLVADATLAPLRLEERKTKAPEEPFKPDDAVRLTDGAYAGLRGKIVKAKGKFASVEIPGFSGPIKVAAYYLLQDDEHSAKLAAA